MSRLSLTQIAIAALVISGLIPVATYAGSPLSPFTHSPDVGNGHKAIYQSTWDSWSRHRLVLGKAQMDEAYVKATAPGLNTYGTAIRFDNGIIFRNNSAPRKGETSAVLGAIMQKYDEVGGAHGRLGFPTGDSYIHDVKRHTKAQNFERGQIYWSQLAQGYVVHYFGE